MKEIIFGIIASLLAQSIVSLFIKLKGTKIGFFRKANDFISWRTFEERRLFISRLKI